MQYGSAPFILLLDYGKPTMNWLEKSSVDMLGIALLRVFDDQRSLILMSKSVSNPESSDTQRSIISDLLPPRQYSERLNKNCGISQRSHTFDVLHDCVCVGFQLWSAFGGSDSRSCTWRQTLASEWKAKISRNQCGHVHNVTSTKFIFFSHNRCP